MSAEWKAEIRFLSSTEKSNTRSIPRTTMLNPVLLFQGKELTLPMGWVLHTCTYVGNLPIDIPLFSKLAPSVSPQSWRNGKYAKCEELWVRIWQQDQDGLLLFKKEIPRFLDVMPIRENVAGDL